MSRLIWGDSGKRLYEFGIDRGVFYPTDGVGVAWSGLTSVSEAPSGSDIRLDYYDGRQFRQIRGGESFTAKIEAFSYPREFEAYDGFDPSGVTQQARKPFGLAYRTRLASAEDSDSAYLLHIVYNALVSPTSRSISTINQEAQASTFQWDLVTLPEILPSGEFSAHLVVNTSIAYPWAVSALEDILYGSVDNAPRIPEITEVVELFENASLLKVTDNGDGSFTVDGPDEAFYFGPNGYFEITWPSAVWIDTNTYRISSL